MTLISFTASCAWPNERAPESRCRVPIRSSKKGLHTKKVYSEISRQDHDRYPHTLREMLHTYTTLNARVFVRENISCSSRIELPYFSVEAYPILCIYCGIGVTKRTLDIFVENYPQCQSCSDKPNVLRRKQKL